MAGSSRTKGIKVCDGDEDLVSALPDCLLQHILSLLPSTRDSIRTSFLSKRWLLQWSHVPVLIFDPNYGMSPESFSDLIEKALSAYNCSKIKKFVIDSNDFSWDQLGSKLDTWIQYAVVRDVKELTLDCDATDLYEYGESYHLPQFLLESASLAKFRAQCCAFMPDANVSWVSLKALYLGCCYLPNHVIRNVLSGCPAIEYLELMHCGAFEELVVVSKSLKMLRICASGEWTAIEICCPNLEELELLDRMKCSSVKLKDLPPSVSVTLNFEIELDDKTEVEFLEFVKETLLQVQHVRELILGQWILMIFSQAAVRDEPCLSLKSKCLTVFDPFFEIGVPGLVYLLLSFPVLEKLKIQLSGGILDLAMVGNKFWELNESLFSCLMSSLKTVEIESLSFTRSKNELLKFAKFILKNARVLEKMALLEQPGQHMDFANEILQKLSGVQISSPRAVVEVASSQRYYVHWTAEFPWDEFGY